MGSPEADDSTSGVGPYHRLVAVAGFVFWDPF
jgi:hypothetical protein